VRQGVRKNRVLGQKSQDIHPIAKNRTSPHNHHAVSTFEALEVALRVLQTITAKRHPDRADVEALRIHVGEAVRTLEVDELACHLIHQFSGWPRDHGRCGLQRDRSGAGDLGRAASPRLIPRALLRSRTAPKIPHRSDNQPHRRHNPDNQQRYYHEQHDALVRRACFAGHRRRQTWHHGGRECEGRTHLKSLLHVAPLAPPSRLYRNLDDPQAILVGLRLLPPAVACRAVRALESERTTNPRHRTSFAPRRQLASLSVCKQKYSSGLRSVRVLLDNG
jgi:hypothetical protein